MQEATPEHKAASGKAWDTVKPLARYFCKLHRVLLVDDDAFKVSILFPITPSCLCMAVAGPLKEGDSMERRKKASGQTPHGNSGS